MQVVSASVILHHTHRFSDVCAAAGSPKLLLAGPEHRTLGPVVPLQLMGWHAAWVEFSVSGMNSCPRRRWEVIKAHQGGSSTPEQPLPGALGRPMHLKYAGWHRSWPSQSPHSSPWHCTPHCNKPSLGFGSLIALGNHSAVTPEHMMGRAIHNGQMYFEQQKGSTDPQVTQADTGRADTASHRAVHPSRQKGSRNVLEG